MTLTSVHVAIKSLFKFKTDFAPQVIGEHWLNEYAFCSDDFEKTKQQNNRILCGDVTTQHHRDAEEQNDRSI